MIKKSLGYLLCPVVCSLFGLNAFAEPLSPTIMRRVDTVSDAKFMYPTLPAVSSTEDGRIGISRDAGGPGFNSHSSLRIMLLKPEAITSAGRDKNFLQMEATNEPVITAGQGKHIFLDGYSVKNPSSGVWETTVDDKIVTKAQMLALPESLVSYRPAGPLFAAASGDAFVSVSLMGPGGSMPLLCEENRNQSGGVIAGVEEVRNPYACSVTVDMTKVGGQRFQIDKSGGNHDCYDIAIIMNSAPEFVDENGDGVASTPYTRLVSRRITVAVASPKTPSAKIVALKDEGLVVAENKQVGGSWLEPNITGDGKLIVTRIGTNFQPVPDTLENIRYCEGVKEASVDGNSGQTAECRSQDVVYSYNPGTRCDVNGFTSYHSLSHAYYDDRLNPSVNHRDSDTSNDVEARYGLAAYPLRSPDGKYFENEQDVQGSYAWMDREGNNFMVTVGGTQTFTDANYTFPYSDKVSCIKPDGSTPLAKCAAEDASLRREANNVTWSPVIAGSWTRGKMIFQDNLLNNSDFAIGVNNWEEKLFDIYADGEPVRVSGRYVSSRKDPPGSVGNTDFFESIENKFNFQDEFKPASFRDVVWKMSSGTATDEFVFDDYISKHSYIVADMVGARLMDHPNQTVSKYSARLLHYPDGSGGANNYLTQVQNGATALGFQVPAVGNVVNFGAGDLPRIEPVALGGIKGRGLWLNGSYGVDFAAAGVQALDDQQVYVGVFVDSRSEKDDVARQIIHFPDGSSIRITKKSTCGAGNPKVCSDTIPFDALGFYNKTGTLVEEWDVTAALSSVVARREQWVHLGFQMDKQSEGQVKVGIYLDGYLFSEWTSTSGAIFNLTDEGLSIDEAITVGATSENNGFHGWVDEFKVILAKQNPELACNHALGTLIGVDDESSDDWKSVADSFGGPLPGSSHDKITSTLKENKAKFYPQYACFHDYRGDNMATRNNVPRKAIDATNYESYGIHYGLMSTAVKAGVPGSVAMPIYHDQARPSFSSNAFCTSCHGDDARTKGLKMAALSAGAMTAVADIRR
ncbi:MAG TPA: hypothetical protein PK244_06920, partial [Pseudomonadales bacterium]|nr:hypothetical protein [Pseudomonadales bacterium]